jgi:hypothetical protein
MNHGTPGLKNPIQSDPSLSNISKYLPKNTIGSLPDPKLLSQLKAHGISGADIPESLDEVHTMKLHYVTVYDGFEHREERQQGPWKKECDALIEKVIEHDFSISTKSSDLASKV